MNNNESSSADRRSVLTGIGLAALAGVALDSAEAKAQEAGSTFTPRRHAQDSWMDALPGDHRVFIDTDNNAGAVNALRYATNILNAHVNAYEGRDLEMAMIVCFRHASTTMGFNDAMWAKYGSTFATMSRLTLNEGETQSSNPQMTAISTAVGRGVQFAVCNSASTMLAGMLARQGNQKAEDVLAELTANLVPNARMVPAGVMALTRAQEYGYSFLYSAA